MTGTLNFETSVSDILASSSPFLAELNKGFSLEVKLELITQLKNFIVKLLNDQKVLNSKFRPFVIGLIPIILLTLKGEV